MRKPTEGNADAGICALVGGFVVPKLRWLLAGSRDRLRDLLAILLDPLASLFLLGDAVGLLSKVGINSGLHNCGFVASGLDLGGGLILHAGDFVTGSLRDGLLGISPLLRGRYSRGRALRAVALDVLDQGQAVGTDACGLVFFSHYSSPPVSELPSEFTTPLATFLLTPS